MKKLKKFAALLRGFFVFGDNCQKEGRNLGDLPVDMRGGGMDKINSDG